VYARNGSAGHCRGVGMPSIQERPASNDISGELMDPQSEPQPDPPADSQPEDLDREPTAAERLEWRRKDTFISDGEATPDEYPRLRNMSAAFMFDAVIRPLEPTQPEYATIAPCVKASLSIRWKTMSESRRLTQRIASIEALPSAFLARNLLAGLCRAARLRSRIKSLSVKPGQAQVSPRDPFPG
jgi:hypothetical protein